MIPYGSTPKHLCVPFIHNNFTQYEEFIVDMNRMNLDCFRSKVAQVKEYVSLHLKKHITSIDLTKKTFHYFLDLIEKQINLIQVNNPEDESLLQKWNKFRCELAFLKYREDPTITQHVQDFLSYLNEKLGQMRQSPEQQLTQNIRSFFDSQIFECISLFTIELSYFCKTVNDEQEIFPYTLLPIKSLQIAYCEHKAAIAENIDWLLKEILSLLTPFQALPQCASLNNTQFILGKMQEFQKNFMPALLCLNVNDLKSVRAGIPQFMKVYYMVRTLTDHKGCFDSQGGAEILPNGAKRIEAIQYIIDIIKEEAESKGYGSDHVYNIDAYLSRFRIIMDESYGCWTLLGLETHLEVLQAQLKCHILLEAYLKPHMIALFYIEKALGDWHKSTHVNRINTLIKEIQQSKIDHVGDQRNLDDLVQDIEGKNRSSHTTQAKTTKKGQRKNPLPNTTQKATQTEVLPLVPLPNASNSSKSQITLTSSERACAIAAKLNSLICSPLYEDAQFYYPKVALRQSAMHFNDLRVVFKKIDKSKSRLEANLSYLAMQVISSSYYHMEQWIRYHQMIQKEPYDPNFTCDRHNLKFLMNDLKTTITSTQAPETLFLGNFWTFNHFEQVGKWHQIEQYSTQRLPKPLSHLSQALSTSSSLAAFGDYFESTITFSEQIPFIDQKGNQAVDPAQKEEIELFKVSSSINSNQLKQFQQQCQGWIETLESLSHPAAIKLRQAHLNIDVLQGIIKGLNQASISSDEFSFLIRNAIFWQNGILECLLQSLCQLKTGLNTKSHVLADIYRKIHPDPSSDDQKVIDILEHDWVRVHHFCRYPFEYNAPFSNTHQLVLKTELLRERPELNRGFKIAGENKKVSTKVNFIQLPGEEITVLSLIKDLKMLLDGAWKLIEERLSPQLTQAVNGK